MAGAARSSSSAPMASARSRMIDNPRCPGVTLSTSKPRPLSTMRSSTTPAGAASLRFLSVNDTTDAAEWRVMLVSASWAIR